MVCILECGETSISLFLSTLIASNSAAGSSPASFFSLSPLLFTSPYARSFSLSMFNLWPALLMARWLCVWTIWLGSVLQIIDDDEVVSGVPCVCHRLQLWWHTLHPTGMSLTLLFKYRLEYWDRGSRIYWTPVRDEQNCQTVLLLSLLLLFFCYGRPSSSNNVTQLASLDAYLLWDESQSSIHLSVATHIYICIRMLEHDWLLIGVCSITISVLELSQCQVCSTNCCF